GCSGRQRARSRARVSPVCLRPAAAKGGAPCGSRAQPRAIPALPRPRARSDANQYWYPPPRADRGPRRWRAPARAPRAAEADLGVVEIYCAQARKYVRLALRLTFNLPRFCRGIFLCADLLLSGVTVMPALLRRVRREGDRAARGES